MEDVDYKDGYLFSIFTPRATYPQRRKIDWASK